MSDETTEKETKAKGSNSILLILVAVIAIAVVGGGGWFFLHQNKTAEAAPQPTSELHTVHLEAFTVNLADVEENHFLRITVDLGLGHLPKAKEGESEIPTARVRDAILTVLSAGKADVLITQEGKVQLKKDILTALHQSVPEVDVREVYFTEFLVQR